MKKNLLGILAVLMVFALALTGCGQNGEQNAGATSPGDNSNAEVSDRDENPTVEEPEDDDKSDTNHNPEMRDGYYVYEVLGEEFLCETNVWDYIDKSAMTFDFGAMKSSLGLGSRDGNYVAGNLELNSPYLLAGSISEVNYNILAFTDDSHTKRRHEALYVIKYSPSSAAYREYSSKSDSNYGFTFDLIVLTVYGCEQLKEDLSMPPLNGHLAEYYDSQTMTYVLP